VSLASANLATGSEFESGDFTGAHHFLDNAVTEASAASHRGSGLPVLLVAILGVVALRRGFRAPIAAPNI
jgi:hypothetical protein